MKKENLAMLCDFYEFTMSNGYFKYESPTSAPRAFLTRSFSIISRTSALRATSGLFPRELPFSRTNRFSQYAHPRSRLR